MCAHTRLQSLGVDKIKPEKSQEKPDSSAQQPCNQSNLNPKVTTAIRLGKGRKKQRLPRIWNF